MIETRHWAEKDKTVSKPVRSSKLSCISYHQLVQQLLLPPLTFQAVQHVKVLTLRLYKM